MTNHRACAGNGYSTTSPSDVTLMFSTALCAIGIPRNSPSQSGYNVVLTPSVLSPFQLTPLLMVLPPQHFTIREMPPLLLIRLPSLALPPSESPFAAAAPLLLLFLPRNTAPLLATGRATLVTLQRNWNRTTSRRR